MTLWASAAQDLGGETLGRAPLGRTLAGPPGLARELRSPAHDLRPQSTYQPFQAQEEEEAALGQEAPVGGVPAGGAAVTQCVSLLTFTALKNDCGFLQGWARG